jgi:hypothetical protein
MLRTAFLYLLEQAFGERAHAGASFRDLCDYEPPLRLTPNTH